MINDFVIAKNDSNLVGCCCGAALSCETACGIGEKKSILIKILSKLF